MEAPKDAARPRVLDSPKPSCRSCVAYRLHSNMVGVLFQPKARKLVAEMGCDKHMPAVQWLGPCPFYEREPGAD